MTLLFMDGFDHYATADITKKWTSNSSSTIAASSGRRSGGCMSFGGGIPVFGASKTLPSTYTTLFVGLAHTGTATGDILQLRETSTIHISVAYDTGKLKVYRGGASAGTLLATGNTTISGSAWNYIELKAVISDTVGTIDVYINGVADTGLALTGQDTRNGGTSGVINNIFIGGTGSTDDLYVCDNAGSTNNTFLGDCRIDTILPSGDGNYLQFTPSTGSTHYTLVDESTPNTSDYVSDATSGDRDSYTYPDLTALISQTVYAVQINAAALKSDSGSRSLGTMSRLSSTDKDGAGAALSTSQTYISEIQETDPASAAWTESNINAAEFGVKVTA